MIIKMNNKIKITVGHIVIFIGVLLTIYVFSTGWQCGFAGDCKYPMKEVWQGIVRFIISIVCGALMILVIVTSWEEGIIIKNPFTKSIDSEAWDEYQQWLKDRNK